MSYQRYNKIEPGDYKGLLTNFNDIWGSGSYSSGYGQPTSTDIPAAGNTIEPVTYWQPIINKITQMGQHTGSSLLPMIPIPTPQGLIVFYNNLTGNLTKLKDEKLNAGTQGTTISNNAATTQNWNKSLTITFTISFDSIDCTRYFFNAGGQLALSFSHSDNIGVNELIKGLCDDTGRIYTSSPTSGQVKIQNVLYSGVTQIGGSTLKATINPKYGLYGLTSAENEIFSIKPRIGPESQLLESNLKITSKLGDAKTIIIKSTFTLSPPQLSVSSGTLATLDVIPPEETYLTKTWGNVNVTSSIDYTTAPVAASVQYCVVGAGGQGGTTYYLIGAGGGGGGQVKYGELPFTWVGDLGIYYSYCSPVNPNYVSLYYGPGGDSGKYGKSTLVSDTYKTFKVEAAGGGGGAGPGWGSKTINLSKTMIASGEAGFNGGGASAGSSTDFPGFLGGAADKLGFPGGGKPLSTSRLGSGGGGAGGPGLTPASSTVGGLGGPGVIWPVDGKEYGKGGMGASYINFGPDTASGGGAYEAPIRTDSVFASTQGMPGGVFLAIPQGLPAVDARFAVYDYGSSTYNNVVYRIYYFVGPAYYNTALNQPIMSARIGLVSNDANYDVPGTYDYKTQNTTYSVTLTYNTPDGDKKVDLNVAPNTTYQVNIGNVGESSTFGNLFTTPGWVYPIVYWSGYVTIANNEYTFKNLVYQYDTGTLISSCTASTDTVSNAAKLLSNLNLIYSGTNAYQTVKVNKLSQKLIINDFVFYLSVISSYPGTVTKVISPKSRNDFTLKMSMTGPQGGLYYDWIMYLLQVTSIRIRENTTPIIYYLVVGGGGGGGGGVYDSLGGGGAGGGGGGVTYGSYKGNITNLAITIGTGGAGGGYATDGSTGTGSKLTGNITVYTTGGGGGSRTTGKGSGGSGTGGSGGTPNGSAGGAFRTNGSSNGIGAGGGSGSNDDQGGNNGGNGYKWPVTNEYYGGGGAGTGEWVTGQGGLGGGGSVRSSTGYPGTVQAIPNNGGYNPPVGTTGYTGYGYYTVTGTENSDPLSGGGARYYYVVMNGVIVWSSINPPTNYKAGAYVGGNFTAGAEYLGTGDWVNCFNLAGSSSRDGVPNTGGGGSGGDEGTFIGGDGANGVVLLAVPAAVPPLNITNGSASVSDITYLGGPYKLYTFKQNSQIG